jgi:hypothetical protein
MAQYTLQVPKDVERQLSGCRLSIRRSIEARIQTIVAEASSKGTRAASQGPPLRFYVFEGCRVTYQVNPVTRTVHLLKLRAESG